ncbi:MAG TPA: branched-chain-amino-acid transaminase [Chitinophagaceae bacterium]|nr:branched-chain-amino-acid transaminase [Chitinophagaceae bacterium]
MATYYTDQTIVYHDGDFVRAAQAMTDLYSQSMHYGYAVFEGIRAYRTRDGQARIFKAPEHFARLRESARALNMPYPYRDGDLIEAAYEVLLRNGLQDAYIRPLVYAPANMSFSRNERSHLVIEAWEMAPFLGSRLLKVMTSSLQRPNPRAFPMHAKASGLYVNSILASQEARARGYDEALLTDVEGRVAEGPGANVFFEKDGRLYTPAPGHILAGITRATVLELCARLNIPVAEKPVSLDELRQADAAFFCGTAAEVIGWSHLDDRAFPVAWEATQSKRIQDAYLELVRQPVYKPTAETV